MATISAVDTNHTRVTIRVADLQLGREQYDKFVYRFFQNGTQVLAYTYDWASGPYTTWDFEFSNNNYLGNNYFAPATTYSITVDCYYNGINDPIGPVVFTTDAVSPPSGSIAPVVYPTIKNQSINGNCVAMSLSTAMEIFRAKVSSYENYSVSYIFGSDGRIEDNMFFESAVQLCETYGSPRWELVATDFPDTLSKSDSRKIFDKAISLAKSNAIFQAFTNHSNIDFYNCAAVTNAIRNYGYFMFNFRVPNNFYSIPSSGIVPQPSGGYSYYNHSLPLIGLTTISGKAYWIAHNSWGESWGNGGRCYIPFDWGCGVQSPQGSYNTEDACGWTCECYSVWRTSISTGNPAAPINLSGSQEGKNTTATINWTTPTTGSSVLLYARKRGTISWWPKPSYGALFSGTSGQISFDKDTTSYEVMAIAVKSSLLSMQTSPITISISLLELWSWTISNGSATPAQTDLAYTALISKGSLSDFSHLVWNDLCDKVNAAAIAKGDAWLENWGTLSETKMSDSSKTLTDRRFNALKNNIGARVSTGILDVEKGATIYGSYFTTLTTKLNDWISSL